MAINHDHLHSTTDNAVSLKEDYRKISEMYIEATNQNGVLELENTELKIVIDELQKRIKELEHKLYGGSGQKCIQQIQVISKLETTVSNLENVQALENSQKENG